MTLFWILSGLLAAVALVLLARPVIFKKRASTVAREALNVSVYRDQLRELDADRAAGLVGEADYEQAKLEIEKRLLQDVEEAKGSGPFSKDEKPKRVLTPFPLIVGIGVPVLAIGVYFAVGNPAAVNLADSHGNSALTVRQMESLVARLHARLKESPDDVEGWRLLGRSYTVMGRFPEAADAYAKAAARMPRDAQLLADFADALAMARGQSLQGEPEKLVLRALELDPKNLKALALAGTAVFDRKDYKAAADYWARMLPLVEPDSENARTIQANVAQARSLSGEKPAPAPAAAPAGKALQGTVRLAPELAAKAAPEDTVFIFARAAKGPPMPLAVLRKRVRDLPVAFALDDSMAMTPESRLSAFADVVVAARVSKSGSVTPGTGDLQGTSSPVRSDAQGVTVIIDKVVQ